MIPRGRARFPLLLALVMALCAGLAFFAVLRWGRRDAGADVAASPADAAVAAPGEVPAAVTADAPPDLPRVPATIYQRARDDEALALVAVPAQILGFSGPVDRARQVVQLVLDGVAPADRAGDAAADAPQGVPPAPPGVRYRDVRLAVTGVAWVDFEGASLAHLGSDHELALAAALTRSLVESLPGDVRAVGFLVDGAPRASLAGHVDTTRPFTAADWPESAAAPP